MCTRHPGHFIQDNAHLSEGNCLHFLKPTYRIQFISLKIFLQTISIVSKYFPQGIHQFIVIKGKNNPFQQRKPGRPPMWTKWPQSKLPRIRYTTTMCPPAEGTKKNKTALWFSSPKCITSTEEPTAGSVHWGALRSAGFLQHSSNSIKVRVRQTTEQSQGGGDQGGRSDPHACRDPGLNWEMELEWGLWLRCCGCHRCTELERAAGVARELGMGHVELSLAL